MARRLPDELRDAFEEEGVVYGIDWNARRGRGRPAPAVNDPTAWDPMRASPLMLFEDELAFIERLTSAELEAIGAMGTSCLTFNLDDDR